MPPLLQPAALTVRARGRRRAVLLALCLLLSGLGLLTRAAAGIPPAIEWVAPYPTPQGYLSEAAAVALDGTGNIIVTGNVSPDDGSGVSGYLTIKYDAVTGEELWAARYDGAPRSGNHPAGLALDKQGNVYVTGYSATSAEFKDYDYTTVKYDGATGQQLWIADYDGPGHSYDEAHALAVDDAGDVYVTGASNAAGIFYDYATVKYDGATGRELWVARYHGPGGGFDTATAIWVDGAHNVYVTGKSGGGDTAYDYATVKYDGSTGQRFWVARYAGPVNIDYPSALAVDVRGNVYVTGSSVGSNYPIYDYATVKYDGATGQQLWVARYDGPLQSDDQANALAVDRAGDVYVTGASISRNGIYDYATVKYNGATGQQLWVARYDGPAHLNDNAFALALDGEGNVYVTGGSATGAGSNDYLTVKYDSRSGAELWSSRYSRVGWGRAVAVDVKGAVYVTGSGFVTIKYHQNTPTLTGVAVSDVSPTGATLTWNTSVPATSSVAYGTASGYVATLTDRAYVSAHRVQLTGLTPGTLYWYRVWSSLEDSTVLGPVTDSFTTLAAPPTLTWGAPSPAPNGAGWNNTSVDLPFTVSPAGVSVSPPSPLHFTTEGAGQTDAVTVTDTDGTPHVFKSPAVNLDFTAPVTSASRAGPLGNNGWYTGPMTVTLAATDALSGVAQTFYTVEGSAPRLYTAPFSVAGDGTHSVTFWSTDRAGNTEAPQGLTLRVDQTAPTVQWGTPTPALNASRWYQSAVDVPFTVSDALSGVAGANPPSPLHLTGEGWNVTGTVTVTDAAGNNAAFSSPPLKIDRTAPHTTAIVSGEGGLNGWYVRPVTVHLEGADALSGVAATYYQVDGGPAQPFHQNVTIGTLGRHQLQFWSVDQAGNTEPTRSLTLRLEATAPVVTIRAVPTSPNAPNGKTARVNVTGTVFNTQAGLDPARIIYTVTGRTGAVLASGPVTLNRRGEYRLSLRLDGPPRGGSPREYLITVQAYDLAGTHGQASAVVKVR